jgi:enamine deaminase RidA (YjgF/YER057c/UK114 family)
MTIAQRLAELDITLPSAPKPVASYIPTRRTGNLVHVSGQIPMRDGALIAKGIIPTHVDNDTALDCARQCTLNALACLTQELGTLDTITKIVKVGGFVASTPDYTDHPKIINACSDLLVEIFGQTIGQHARAAVGVSSLPLGAPVEIEFIVEVSDVG